jgi:GGDEF domain-containing protein
MRLVRHLPALVEDSLAAAARADHHARQSRRASTDALTGVGSRGEIGLRLGLTSPGDLVCMVDLDGLKEINDSNGHDAGDEVLRNFGAALRAAIREGDFVGRYGGDEFVVILTASPVAVVIERLGALSASWTLRRGRTTSSSVRRTHDPDVRKLSAGPVDRGQRNCRGGDRRSAGARPGAEAAAA